MCTLEGPTVHVFKEDFNLTGVIEHIVALNHVEVVNVSKDLDFPADLAADVVLVIPVNNLEGVELSGGTVEDFVDGTAGAAADSVHSVELGEVDRWRSVRELGRG